jgi:tetratricopeptide (TPR) repeat protein
MAAGVFSPAAWAVNPTLQFLEQRVAADPLDHLAHNRLALEYVNAMRSSGELELLDRAERSARASLQAVPASRNPNGLTALAVAQYESHQFREALEAARQARVIDPSNLLAHVTSGDAQLELGDYDAARLTYAAAAARLPKAALHLRLSRLAEIDGEDQPAMELLLQLAGTSEDSLGARLRLAELYFGRGNLGPARVHLEAAQRMQPDDLAVQEHQAELHAARGEHAAAIALYQRVIARVPRPEYMHALGDLLAFLGRAGEARVWHSQALQRYLQFTRGGNAHYYHHLASFYSDSQPNPEQALRWARRDLQIRNSIYAYGGLAWALYKNGEYTAAAAAMDRALSRGTRSAHLLYHAGMIYANAGRATQGRKLIQQALIVNPRYQGFHVHR